MDDCTSVSAESVHDLIDGLRRSPVNLHTQRQLGAFYTCPNTAEFMADWALRGPADRILEPSFGSGIFLHAARLIAERRYQNNVHLIGCELSTEEFSRAKKSLFNDSDIAYRGDFLGMPVREVDAVIGNPRRIKPRSAISLN